MISERELMRLILSEMNVCTEKGGRRLAAIEMWNGMQVR